VSAFLLDVNLLVALLWANHEHHAEASEWFRSRGDGGWATCPLTQAGFVRVSSNPRVFSDAPSPSKVVEILHRNTRHPTHRFIKDDLALSKAVGPFLDRFSGHQQTTDAYLFGLAIHHRCVLATFDRGVSDLAGGDAWLLKALEILPVR